MAWKEEYWKSIKSFDTEEKLDLYFYRPIGFVIAKFAFVLGMSPTALTIIGLIFGLISGVFFSYNESNTSLILASFLFVFAGILDSSDGQLARMGGRSTKLGLVLDGLCDNLVFAAAYIGSALTIKEQYGLALIPISLLAGICHSAQSAMLDFYNREYLYFGYGKIQDDYWNGTLEEAAMERDSASTQGARILASLRFSWVWQQNKITTRTTAERRAMQALVTGKNSAIFQNEYKKYNRTILRFWRLMGPNFHTIAILVCVFLRRFDLYLIAVDIIALTIALFVLRFFQCQQDQKLFRSLKSKNLL
jgi:hypothetical protein